MEQAQKECKRAPYLAWERGVIVHPVNTQYKSVETIVIKGTRIII